MTLPRTTTAIAMTLRISNLQTGAGEIPRYLFIEAEDAIPSRSRGIVVLIATESAGVH